VINNLFKQESLLDRKLRSYCEECVCEQYSSSDFVNPFKLMVPVQVRRKQFEGGHAENIFQEGG
jgi:hypothetical protein